MVRTRRVRVEVHLSGEENKMLRALVKQRGLTAADVIRQLIRRESEAVAKSNVAK